MHLLQKGIIRFPNECIVCTQGVVNIELSMLVTKVQTFIRNFVANSNSTFTTSLNFGSMFVALALLPINLC